MIALLLISYFLAVIASLADGMVEGYEFDDRKSFERKFGVAPNSFWGSLSWKNAGTWLEKKIGTFDFYHVADDIRAWFYRFSGAALGAWVVLQVLQCAPWYYIALQTILYFVAAMATKRGAMAWIRK